MSGTRRRYLDDSYLDACEATVTAVDGNWMQLSDTVAYPGGGGQPADRLYLHSAGGVVEIDDTKTDAAGAVWVHGAPALPVGHAVACRIDWGYRYGVMRHHALVHVVNTIVRRAHGGAQTGTQLGPRRSRVDVRIPSFERSLLPELEAAVNEVIGRDMPISASLIAESEYRSRPELDRTRDVPPAIDDGRVRVVEIHGFDAQACGGTHVHSTSEIGRATVDGYEHNGRDQRVYWVLD